jgi:hypothetical protein
MILYLAFRLDLKKDDDQNYQQNKNRKNDSQIEVNLGDTAALEVRIAIITAASSPIQVDNFVLSTGGSTWLAKACLCWRGTRKATDIAALLNLKSRLALCSKGAGDGFIQVIRAHASVIPWCRFANHANLLLKRADGQVRGSRLPGGILASSGFC